MRYIEALEEYQPQPGEISLFLGGGITGAGDWQAEVVAALSNTDLVLLNPRRKDFPIDDPSAAEPQIEWEYLHLAAATAILFWFPPETLCPITLFEYGKWLVSGKRLFVGCHPQYKRLFDVQVQTRLERPTLSVALSIQELVEQVAQSMIGLDRPSADTITSVTGRHRE